jgi:flagellin
LGSFNGLVESNVTYTANDSASAKNVTFSATGATSLGNLADDAKVISNALNASGLGFTATAGTTTVTGTTSDLTGNISGKTDTFVVNGVSISLTSTGNAASNRTHAVSQINAQTSSTGVTATDTGDKVDLTAADGRNITIAFTKSGNNGGAADEQAFGLTTNDAAGATTTTGAVLGVTLKTANTGNVRLNGIAAGANGFANSAAAIGTVGTALSSNDITTASNATSMITAVDAALDSVNTSRADLGALQNRFDSIVNSVLIASENQSAARSRIVDADFAQETATLTRGQILQQAGVAVLAQANASPQNVLALLQ